MIAEVKLAPLDFTKIELVVSGCATLASLIKVDQRSLFRAIFDEKGRIFEIFTQNFS